MTTARGKWRRALAWAAGALSALAIGQEIYTRWPSSADLPPLGLDADTSYVVLLIHGSRGSNEPAFIEMERRFDEAFGDAPGHNEPYDHAHNVDVTDAPGRAGFDRPGHYYPLRFFLDGLDDDEMRPRLRTHADAPRGEVVFVESDLQSAHAR